MRGQPRQILTMLVERQVVDKSPVPQVTFVPEIDNEFYADKYDRCFLGRGVTCEEIITGFCQYFY